MNYPYGSLVSSPLHHMQDDDENVNGYPQQVNDDIPFPLQPQDYLSQEAQPLLEPFSPFNLSGPVKMESGGRGLGINMNGLYVDPSFNCLLLCQCIGFCKSEPEFWQCPTFPTATGVLESSSFSTNGSTLPSINSDTGFMETPTEGTSYTSSPVEQSSLDGHWGGERCSASTISLQAITGWGLYLPDTPAIDSTSHPYQYRTKSSTWPPCHVQGPLEHVSPKALDLRAPETPLSPEEEYSERQGNLSGSSKPLKRKSNRRGKTCLTGKNQKRYLKDEYQKESLIDKRKPRSPPKTHVTCDFEIAGCLICDWAESTDRISARGTLPEYVQKHIHDQHRDGLKAESPKIPLTSRRNSKVPRVEKAAREEFNLKGGQGEPKIRWLSFCPVCKKAFEARTEVSTFKDVRDRVARHDKFTSDCVGSSPKEPQFECGYCGAMLSRIDSRAKHEASCNGKPRDGAEGDEN